MPAAPELRPAMETVATAGQPTSTRKSRRVRFTLPSGRVVFQATAELDARNAVVLATGAVAVCERAASADAVLGHGTSPARVAQKRHASRGGVPLKRFKRCHRIDDAAGGDSTGSGPETSSRDDQLDACRHLVSSANISGTSHPSTACDGFMDELMAMADDECNLHKGMKILSLECENSCEMSLDRYSSQALQAMPSDRQRCWW
ncbi:uncharacterized protein LOC125944389 [Dermacentor silvarum]|uniref:uncharacterized protein LOC125944389 n=1 Tax=Dermacentor silvarum TaxID=543639 RepID=UPI0021011A74|nr:uncharacterized protein LOC125944389 [Dermacentor silvarum]